MYSGQLDQFTSFSLADLSVLLQVLAVCWVPDVPHALSSPEAPTPSPPTAAAERMNDLRLRSAGTMPASEGGRVRRDWDIHGLRRRRGGFGLRGYSHAPRAVTSESVGGVRLIDGIHGKRGRHPLTSVVRDVTIVRVTTPR